MQPSNPARPAWALLILLLCSLSVLADEKDPRRPAAVRTQEVPAVPEEVFQRLAQYANTRSASFAGWDPQGRGMLIGTRFGNTSQLHRVYEPGGRREQVTFFEEPVQGSFLRNAMDSAILMRMSQGGDENYQVYLLADFETAMLTDGQSRNSLQAMRADGSQVAIASNRRNGRDTDLYLADPRQPDAMQLVLETSGEYWYAADWSPDGKTILIGRYISINEGELALLDVATREKTDMPLPDGKRGAVAGLAYAADGNSIFVVTDTNSEFRQLAQLDLASRRYEWRSADIPWDVSGLAVDERSGVVAFTVNEDGASRLYLIHEGDRQEVDLPLGIVSSLEFSPDSTQLGMTFSRANAPSEAYSLQLSDLSLHRWTYSEVGGLDPARFVVPERIQFESFDGLTVPAYVYKPQPASDTPRPVLVIIHGGPEGQFRPYFSSAIQYYVNELGLVVICPNVRGSSGYGKTYLKLDNAEKREDSVRDIGALLDWIDKQQDLDANRVAVSGGSYGGYMVLGSLIHFGERIRAGIDIVGIANFITFLEKTAPYRQDLRRVEYGDERDPKMRAIFEQINPTGRADEIRSALLVAHGVNDPRVPFYEAEQIADRVREQGRPVWTIYATNEGHGFAKKDNRDYLRGVQVMFLRRHLELD